MGNRTEVGLERGKNVAIINAYPETAGANPIALSPDQSWQEALERLGSNTRVLYIGTFLEITGLLGRETRARVLANSSGSPAMYRPGMIIGLDASYPNFLGTHDDPTQRELQEMGITVTTTEISRHTKSGIQLLHKPITLGQRPTRRAPMA